MKAFLGWLISYRVGQLRYAVAKTYIGLATQLYKSSNIVFGMILFITLFMSGLILVTFGIAMILPLSLEERGFVVLSVGVAALAISFVGYFSIRSEKAWIKYLGIGKTLEEIVGGRIQVRS